MLSKQIFQCGVIQSEGSAPPVDKLLAVIQFDWANENSIKAVFRALNSTRKIPQQFSILIRDTDALLVSNNLGNLPNQAHLTHIHNIRNDAQHHARYPNDSSATWSGGLAIYSH